MTEFNTPTKIVNLVKMTLRKTENEVQIGRKLMMLLKLIVNSGKMIHFLPSYVF
jgi:aromatic ring-opening dioxygenase catalytic subunit (LigB family)